MKIGRNASTGRFTTTSAKTRPKPAGGAIVIRNEKTGRELPLKGYGSMKGRFAVEPGVDLSKPIAAQTLAKKKQIRLAAWRPDYLAALEC